MPYKYLIGIDEAGRGPLAGPVAVAAIIIFKKSYSRYFKGVKDSKKLSELQRNEWYAKIKKAKESAVLNYSVALTGPVNIDKKGIVLSIRYALNRSLQKFEPLSPDIEILLDGGLRAPRRYINQKTIIKGDEKKIVIALASIVAKVTRDRKMTQLPKNYSKYKFNLNKGYGTKAHYTAIKKHGLSDIHRKTFLKGICSSH